jgi:hypothetical protein
MRLSAMGDVAMTVPVCFAVSVKITVNFRRFFVFFYHSSVSFAFDEKQRHKGFWTIAVISRFKSST